MARYHATVETGISAEDTFTYLADFSSTAEWDPGVVEAERTTAGPIAVGTAFKVVSSFMRRRIPLDYSITALEPGRRVVLQANNGTIRSTDQITISPREFGALVEYEAELKLVGAYRIADPILRIFFRRIGDRARVGLARELNRKSDQ